MKRRTIFAGCVTLGFFSGCLELPTASTDEDYLIDESFSGEAFYTFQAGTNEWIEVTLGTASDSDSEIACDIIHRETAASIFRERVTDEETFDVDITEGGVFEVFVRSDERAVINIVSSE
ncbi:hypothetical protein GS429_12110 [Natronorubrum sp. JWXQ-INN-674]|uniref:Lipoprotein n=1 Tax=Natronorubrum halalkaliphilum TaxID=2691917 RepID=A0A6B0VP94_9EURY|nr:hypothetical protein [Natronorubrum halalkaliphilum]MXV62796.1 hypothetical protein [Natronorubrum halalkaliphilum]